MFDIVRRRNYDTRRVLIDSARVLDSPFDDSFLCLTGSEFELLRNLTQYLHRQDTFVATYYSNHYLTPDLEAWDSLQAIVAGLEEKIMGCAELEQIFTDLQTLATPIDATWRLGWSAGVSGTEVKYITAPAEGIRRTVHRIVLKNSTRIGETVSIGFHDPVNNTTIHEFEPTEAGELMIFDAPFRFSYPDSVYVVFTGCENNDNLLAFALQTDMQVPS